jgi:hypothetical protein
MFEISFTSLAGGTFNLREVCRACFIDDVRKNGAP